MWHSWVPPATPRAPAAPVGKAQPPAPRLFSGRRQSSAPTDHFPLGFVVRSTQAKWNHSIGHCKVEGRAQ